MKIGIVLEKTPSYSETFFLSKLKGLAKAGNKMILFVNKRQNDFNVDGIKVVTAYPVNRMNPFVIVCSVVWVLFRLIITTPAQLVNFVRLEREGGAKWIDCIQKIYLSGHILSYQVDWLHFGFISSGVKKENVARAIGARMAVSIRGFDIGIYPLKHPGCYSLIWDRVDALHYLSDDLLFLAEQNGLKETTTRMKIAPAIEAEKFSVNRSFANNKDTIKIVSVGRLSWKKGYEYAINAVALIKRMGYKVHLTIIGSGSEEERLKYAAFQQNIQNEVRFAGRLSHGAIINNLAEADIYIQPSVQEGFCNATLEAQASGLLCVVSDAEGLSENVIHGHTGWVVPRRNSYALAHKIIEVFQMSSKDKEAISKRAKERVNKEFCLKDQILKFEKFYGSK